jgi:outer membrane biogenesis lipoprotein LolB
LSGPRDRLVLGLVFSLVCSHLILLVGCTQTRLPSAPLETTSGAVALGQWAGRFAVKVDKVTVAETQSTQQDSAQGGFSLQSTSEGTTLELNSPLGQTIAVVRSKPGNATLSLADGKQYEAANPQDLLENQLGWRLPIDRLPRALAALNSDAIPSSNKAEVIAESLGRDWNAQLTSLEGDRSRLVLTWQGLSRNVSKLVLTLIIEPQVGVSTNLRR